MQAAFSLNSRFAIRADRAFGASFCCLKSCLGPAQAVIATAHKIARVVYHMLKFKVEYQALSAHEYDQRFHEREIRYLQRKAAKLGFTLAPSTLPILAVS